MYCACVCAYMYISQSTFVPSAACMVSLIEEWKKWQPYNNSVDLVCIRQGRVLGDNIPSIDVYPSIGVIVSLALNVIGNSKCKTVGSGNRLQSNSSGSCRDSLLSPGSEQKKVVMVHSFRCGGKASIASG